MSNSDSLPTAAPTLRRRTLAGAAALGAAAVAATARTAPAAAADTRITLHPDASTGVAARDLALEDVAPRAAGSWRTPVLETATFALLGVTWRSGTGRVRARVRRRGGGWETWQELPMLHDLPDRGSSEARRTPHATEPVWVGDCDAVQVEVIGSAQRPVLSLVDPGRRRGDLTDRADLPPSADRTAAADAVHGRRAPRRPRIRSRRAWGAKKKWATGKPKRVSTVEQVHVHHTATGNDYRKRDVPRMLRAIYRYHTQSLGWSDVGYNFFVDRFGRIWAGRRRPGTEIRGAHTLGFNHTSVGIAVLGNHEQVAPTGKVIGGVAKVAAWKLAKYGRDPLGTTVVVSRGSDRFPKGTPVALPVIDGHRDTNETACPGAHLYAALPLIRARTAKRMGIVPQRTS